MKKRLSEDILFGEWVRQRRHILDLTQQELADQVGCARITLRRIEAGTLKPSRALAQILLEKLGKPLSQEEEWLQFARGLSGLPGSSVASFEGQPLTNLPTSLTSFIGRGKEQDEVIQLIEKNRLVTIAGVGGIGKTRLALQIGQKLLNDFQMVFGLLAWSHSLILHSLHQLSLQSLTFVRVLLISHYQNG